MPLYLSELTGTESSSDSSSSMDSGELDRLVEEVSKPRIIPVRGENSMYQWMIRQRDSIQSPISLDTPPNDDTENEETKDDKDEGLENFDSYGEEDTTVPQDEEKGDDNSGDNDGVVSAVESEGMMEGRAPAGASPKATSSTQFGADVESCEDFNDGGGLLPKYQDTAVVDSLNRELDVFGLPRVSLTKSSELVSTFWDALTELKERGRVVQTQADEIARLQSSLYHVNHNEADLTDHIGRLKHAVSVAESRANAAEMELNSFRASKAEEIKWMQTTLSNTAAQLRQSEHRVTAKEVVNSRLMKKLHDVAKRERLKALEGDGEKLKGLEVELIQKRKEVARLGEMLRQRENELIRIKAESRRLSGTADLSIGSVPVEAEVGTVAALRTAVDERDRAIVALQLVKGQLNQRVDASDAKLAELEVKLRDKDIALENMKEELYQRPSVAEFRERGYRIEELELDLAERVTKAKEAYDVNRLRRHYDTKELIRRDKENARLGLKVIDSLPLHTLREVAREACRQLGVSDIGEIGPSIAKLTKVVLAIPRLSNFASKICTCVLEGGLSEEGAVINPSHGSLETAVKQVQKLSELHHAILQELLGPGEQRSASIDEIICRLRIRTKRADP